MWRPAASSEQSVATATRTVVSLDIENMSLENLAEGAKVVQILDLIIYIGLGSAAHGGIWMASMCRYSQ